MEVPRAYSRFQSLVWLNGLDRLVGWQVIDIFRRRDWEGGVRRRIDVVKEKLIGI